MGKFLRFAYNIQFVDDYKVGSKRDAFHCKNTVYRSTIVKKTSSTKSLAMHILWKKNNLLQSESMWDLYGVKKYP